MKSYQYNVYNTDGRLVLANAQRRDIAELTGRTEGTIGNRLKNAVSAKIAGYTIKCTLERSNEGPVNSDVKKILESGIWNEVCAPFRKLQRR